MLPPQSALRCGHAIQSGGCRNRLHPSCKEAEGVNASIWHLADIIPLSNGRFAREAIVHHRNAKDAGQEFAWRHTIANRITHSDFIGVSHLRALITTVIRLFGLQRRITLTLIRPCANIVRNHNL